MQNLSVETDARGVATLTLRRAEKHNALSAALIDEVTQAAHILSADDAVRVVILAGEGASFCAGGDLGWMKDQIAADSAGKTAAARSIATMLGALNDLPKPLIGRVHGNTFGGGVGLACVCDVAIASDTAMFGLTETRLGLVPATIGPYVVARMGEAHARRVFMSSRRFDAVEAVTLGIVARAVTASALDDAIAAEVTPYLGCAPGAVAAAKRLARNLGPRIDAETVAMSIEGLIAQWEGDEAREGIAAFFEKRKPRWAE